MGASLRDRATRPADQAPAGLGDTASVPSTTDWIEEGRKHFLASKLHPEKPCGNYPTQDVHTPKDEADFILGYNAAKGEWGRSGGLSGTTGYAEEHEASQARGEQ